jgi:endoglucanase
MRNKHLLISLLTGFLVACGGGGGGSDTPPRSSTPTSSSPASSSSAISTSLSSSSSSVASSSAQSSSSSSTASSSQGSAAETPYIVVDQFGYLPDAQKIAVIRDPVTGYDAAESFTPSSSLTLVNLDNNEVVLTAAVVAWSSGETDTSSGDKAWWFDFSSVTTPGNYAVFDSANNVRSPGFKIAADVYKPVLKEAFRTFFYQRAGFAKAVPYAEAAWADTASHIGTGQDTQARIYNEKNNAATEKDLSGGWYDAGDYNKYTTWAADYVITLLHAYEENKSAWGDDFNIPESNNDIPDILDEVKWGLDWLIKMQNATGNNSVLSIVGLSHSKANDSHASPPSSATGRSYYGPATTNATMSTAAAFAFASKVLKDIPELANYADDLKTRAENAWTWAVANPNVVFFNNDESRQPGSSGLGAGQQEPIDWDTGFPNLKDRATKKRIAAIYLYAATNGADYKTYLESNYTDADLENFADSFREFENTALLYYANLDGVTPAVANNIKTWFTNAMNSNDNWNAMTNKRDPYLAFINVYTWSSNSTKSMKGSMFMDLIEYGVGNFNATQAKNHALTYVNYLHGVNPQGMVYLSNMYSLGAHKSVNEFYHSWFYDGSATWDRVGTSTFGPAPGFLTGGPNPSYHWDTNRCGSGTTSTDPLCNSTVPQPPYGQPAQKSYKDFNTSWPINSWSVTENSCGYQTNYLRLLSKFVN